MEHHVPCQDGGADLEEAQRTQGGKGEAVELISLVPKRARQFTHVPRSKTQVGAAPDPQEFSAMDGQEGKRKEGSEQELMSSWWKWVPRCIDLGEDPTGRWGARGVVEAKRTVSAGAQLDSGNFLSKTPGRGRSRSVCWD